MIFQYLLLVLHNKQAKMPTSVSFIAQTKDSAGSITISSVVWRKCLYQFHKTESWQYDYATIYIRFSTFFFLLTTKNEDIFHKPPPRYFLN